jgi:hypothetical protein
MPGAVKRHAPCQLVHITDQLSNRHYLVDTGEAYSIFHHFSSSPPSGPPLVKIFHVGGKGSSPFFFQWETVHLAFPIIGVDFLSSFKLLVGPAGNQMIGTILPQSFHSISTSSTSAEVGSLQAATCDGAVLQEATCAEQAL